MSTLSPRIWSKVEITGGCWLWTGCTNSKGYGVVSVAGRRQLVHCVSYEAYVGAIPEGFTIDHVRDFGCTSKLCLNLAHLQPVTRRENSQRYAQSISRCKNGHQLVAREGDRQRRCRLCKTERRHTRKALARAA